MYRTASWRRAPSAAALVVLLAMPVAAAAQTVDGRSIAGDWVRAESSYNPLDGMRISVEGTGARVTLVPEPSRVFRAGQALWQSIGLDGSVRVRGSDGNYYSGKLSFDDKYLHLDIDNSGIGTDQRWKRAGPSINGVWVRISPPGPSDQLRIRVAGDAGKIIYLPAGAPRKYRTGIRAWKDISEGGAAMVMGSDGRYVSARITLESSDRLRVDIPSRVSEVWVRRGSENTVTTTAGLPDPRPGPDDRLTPIEELPTIDVPETPPIPPAPVVACVSTSLRHDGTGKSWNWSVSSPTNNDADMEVRGLRVFRGEYEGSLQRYNVLTDLDRFRAEGMEDGHVFVWHPKGPVEMTKHHLDLTSAEYHEKWNHYEAIGYRPTDIEAYGTADGLRFAGVWASNPKAVDWWSQRNMTAEEYGTSYEAKRGEGFRLVDIEVYWTPSGLRYAAIWLRSCDNTNWAQYRDMSRQVYSDSIESLGARGFRVVDFESYRTAAGQRFAAIWEKIPTGRSWQVRTDRTLTSFLNYHKRYVDNGLRLVDFEAYETNDGIRYGGVWAENDARHDFALRKLLNDSIAKFRTDHGIMGMSVVVIKDGEIIYRKGFGWADSAAAKWAHSGTIYQTASISKVIGGTLAARLHERRSDFDVTSPTADYLDDLPDHHTHTVDQLLFKTACVHHYDEGPEPDRDRTYRWRVDALEQIWDTPLLRLNVDRGDWLNCEPGTRYHYSTHGFTFVGAVLESVTGRDIAQLLEDEISKPFALTTLQAAVGAGVPSLKGGRILYDLAQGYAYDTTANWLNAVDYENTSWKVLGGGMVVDAMDLARFGWLTLNGSIVTTGTRDTVLWSPIAFSGTQQWPGASTVGFNVGLAWNLRMRNGGKNVAEHGGAAFAARPHLRVYRDPADQLVVAIMNNQGRSVSTEGYQPTANLATKIARIVFNNLPPP